MIIRLIEEKKEDRGLTFVRFQTFVRWLSVNSIEADMKKEVLTKIDFDHFTFKELVSDVRESDLYPVDKIMERMDKLFDAKNEEWMSLAASGE